jgi:hypothetical protein
MPGPDPTIKHTGGLDVEGGIDEDEVDVVDERRTALFGSLWITFNDIKRCIERYNSKQRSDSNLILKRESICIIKGQNELWRQFLLSRLNLNTFGRAHLLIRQQLPEFQLSHTHTLTLTLTLTRLYKNTL